MDKDSIISNAVAELRKVNQNETDVETITKILETLLERNNHEEAQATLKQVERLLIGKPLKDTDHSERADEVLRDATEKLASVMYKDDYGRDLKDADHLTRDTYKGHARAALKEQAA